MLKRYLVLSVATAAFSLPSLVNAAQQNILSVQTATTGDYRVVFKTGDYFKKQNLESFFPEIPVEFHINKVNEHYHVPLLLSQYGYSTYRGS